MAASARERAARSAAAPARPHDAGARGQRVAAARSPGEAGGPSRSPNPAGAAAAAAIRQAGGRASTLAGGARGASRVPWI